MRQRRWRVRQRWRRRRRGGRDGRQRRRRGRLLRERNAIAIMIAIAIAIANDADGEVASHRIEQPVLESHVVIVSSVSAEKVVIRLPRQLLREPVERHLVAHRQRRERQIEAL